MFKSKNIQIYLAVSIPGASLLQTNTLYFFASLMSFYVQKNLISWEDTGGRPAQN